MKYMEELFFPFPGEPRAPAGFLLSWILSPAQWKRLFLQKAPKRDFSFPFPFFNDLFSQRSERKTPPLASVNAADFLRGV